MTNERTRDGVGRRARRADARAKTRGTARYPSDLGGDRPDLLYAGVVRSDRPHAEIGAVDTAAAAALDGVVSVVPRTAFLGRFDDRVRHYGDAIAAVAAETPAAAAAAVDAVTFDLDPLESVHDPRESLRGGAPAVQPAEPDWGQPVRHPRSVENPAYEQNVDDYHSLSVGDVDAGFAAADHVLEAEYRSPRVDHCNLDSHCVVAEWEGDTLVCTETIGNTTNTEQTLGRFLGEAYDVRVESAPHSGSSFGGRSLATLTLEPVAATLARETGRPVKLWFDREDDFTAGDARHPATVRVAAGATDDGDLTTLAIDVVADTGAYPNGVGHIVLSQARDRPIELYGVDNYRFEGVSAFTNNPPAGEYRGIGIAQVAWALESGLDELARQAGFDPVAFRRANWVESGDDLPHTDVPVGSCGLEECLERGREAFASLRADAGAARASDAGAARASDARAARASDARAARASDAGAARNDATTGDSTVVYGRGVAAGVNATTPAGPGHGDYSEARVVLDPGGRLEVRSPDVELGQGSETVLAQMAAEETGLPLDRIDVVDAAPDDGVEDRYGSIGNRTTYLTGRAVVDATGRLLARLRERVVETGALDAPADRLSVADGALRGPDGEAVPFEDVLDGPLSATGRAETDVAPSSFGVHFAEVAVDTGTGATSVTAYVAAQDVGYAVNPALVEGQLEGAVQHGIEFATLSELRLDRGIPANATLADYPVSGPAEMPDRMECVIVESAEGSGPYGAKGVGTPSILPVAPAVTNAVRDAVGTRFTTAPVRDEDVLFALREGEE